MNLKLWLSELGIESDCTAGLVQKEKEERAQGPLIKATQGEEWSLQRKGEESSVGGSGWGVGWVWGQGGICISWLSQI